MRDIDFQATKLELQQVIARILHSPAYAQYATIPLNFEIYLFPSKNANTRQTHRGCGLLTLPSAEVGHRLLQEYGQQFRRIVLRRRPIQLSQSKNSPSTGILERIRRMPYVSPEAVQREQARLDELQRGTVGIRTIQFGWETRDGLFSIEWDRQYEDDCQLSFGDERRELRIQILGQETVTRSIVSHFSHITWSATGQDDQDRPIIFLSLQFPPLFDSKPSNQTRLEALFGRSDQVKRQRLLSLYTEDEDGDHTRVLPYATLAIRLVARSEGDMAEFLRLAKVANLYPPRQFCHRAQHLRRFSPTSIDTYHAWVRQLPWPIAFQVESLLRNRLADVKEVLSIGRHIVEALRSKGSEYIVEMLQTFRGSLAWPEQYTQASFAEMYLASVQDYSRRSSPSSRAPDLGVFQCFHVSVSPTAMKLDGPLPERSNRIMRMYSDNQDSFLRVSFVEENNLQYQHDREIDGPSFIHRWVRCILRDGLTIGGRHFRFLAYSQSALKTHTVWFVKKFKDSAGHTIDASTIIRRLGTFENLVYDPRLIYCPARYAARISQAFTSTDSSVSVEVEEIFVREDIQSSSGKWCFTDGVGTISTELAKSIWKELRKGRKRVSRRAITYPRAFQVRFQGSKGMLSVDHTLSGRVVNLRRSMIKFEAPDSLDMEIAQAFVRPSRFYLNRPLIMILEGLGVPYDVFKHLQDAAIHNVHEATRSLVNAANVLEQFGLGTSFRLPSVLLHLAKLDLSPDTLDEFYHQMLEFAIHHIMRDLKQHARIPVHDGYTLVGVADVHRYLEPNQIFACISDPETHEFLYLKGPTLISRSPTIHPGDVQLVQAIGRPPPGSPFAKEPLPNTVVFSVKGERPLPSYLGGGDLDGDLYNVSTFPDLLPRTTFEPAAYEPAPKKYLDRPSTMDDVADFVADYIINDLLGMVAIFWLLIADANPDGIFCQDCLTLGQIHSDAVDYPKSGQPVSMDSIPKPKGKVRPDWNAGEMVDLDNTANYYESQRAIGRLFRDIDLPAVTTANRTARFQRRRIEAGTEPDLEDIFAELCLDDHGDLLYAAVESRVDEFISTDPHNERVGVAIELLEEYARDLQAICAACTLSQRRGSAMLTEEEAVIGTIVAKCSQPRKRKDMVAQLRDQTSFLVKHVREEIAGDDDSPKTEWLQRAWAAWTVSRVRGKYFGAKSFGWIALGEVFDAIRGIEMDEQRSLSHR
ncbi:RdRP-domain-containing protein [Artomyces pyxidatus]|uniref:RdRP-domain-containing protein n=1 Tax=Artomyces pyxidatus TaxID=48021 RepID=A0ACB8TJ90_9AGAM|nr:RdRP-domain-containing protein [Artomyces pyxidatus]